MPTYEYRCKDCRDQVEVQQAFSDDPLTVCPSCGGTLKKKFSSVGISFKGSGFYKTDSRSSSGSGAKEPAAKESSAPSDGSSSSDSSTTKPEPAKKADPSPSAPAAASA